MAKIKVGVVGTGFIAPAHIEALRRLPNIEVAALCDSTIESATVKASKLGIERVGFAKTLAVVWIERLIQWLTLLKIRPRCPSFPEWPKHVPGTSQLASFAGRGHGWLAL
jgi:Oxidoreductase family, NAD-binding Rossmann fold